MADRTGLTTSEQIEAMRTELAYAGRKKQHLDGRPAKSRNPVFAAIKLTLFIALFLFLVFILLQIFVARANNRTPDVFGYQVYVVQTGSMDPTLPVGSVIVSKKPGDPSAIGQNSIISFLNSKGETVTHRIIEVVRKEDGTVSYRTKGDNPINSPDPDLVEPSKVQAVFLFKIPIPSLNGT